MQGKDATPACGGRTPRTCWRLRARRHAATRSLEHFCFLLLTITIKFYYLSEAGPGPGRVLAIWEGREVWVKAEYLLGQP